MKLLFVAIILCVAQSQVRGYRRQGNFLDQDTPYPGGPIPTDEEFWRHNGNGIMRHQTNVITGRLIVRVGELLSFVISKLQQLKDIFDKNGWTNLANYMGQIIDYLNQQNDQTTPGPELYKRDVYPTPYPPNFPPGFPPCTPMDTRPQCIGYGR